METTTLKEICPTTTFKKLESGALLVDVRREKEVSDVTYDVPDYVSIPLSQLEDRMDEIPRDREVIMACRSGSRSLRATLFLMNHGYENVYNLKGGLLKWVQKGFPAKGNVQGLLNAAACDCSKPDCC
ncbi:MAG: rhodanese-like domain-containing protein [Bacteroidetes bacterium]|nr:MAG: rhodanese-like domain-containing protein [Bacteroidota bacterium]